MAGPVNTAIPNTVINHHRLPLAIFVRRDHPLTNKFSLARGKS